MTADMSGICCMGPSMPPERDACLRDDSAHGPARARRRRRLARPADRAGDRRLAGAAARRSAEQAAEDWRRARPALSRTEVRQFLTDPTKARRLDKTFGGQGSVVHDGAAGAGGWDSGSSIALDSSGRILVAGSSQNGSDYDMVIWRYR